MVSREDDVELVGGFRKEAAVCETGPAHLNDGLDLMVCQELGEPSRERFIQQDSHVR